jgi:hypothetical protein
MRRFVAAALDGRVASKNNICATPAYIAAVLRLLMLMHHLMLIDCGCCDASCAWQTPRVQRGVQGITTGSIH